MSATTIGNVAFGLTAETGIFAQSTTFTGTVEQSWVKDVDGDDVAGTFYNPGYTWSVEGQINSGSTLNSYILGATVSMANAPGTIHTGGTITGKSYVTGVELTKSTEDHQMANISGVIKPFS